MKRSVTPSITFKKTPRIGLEGTIWHQLTGLLQEDNNEIVVTKTAITLHIMGESWGHSLNEL